MSKLDDILKESFHENGTILILRDKYIGIRGCMELAKKESLKTVKQLVLPGNQIFDEGLEALTESPYLGNLELLNANQNEIGDDGAALSTSVVATTRPAEDRSCSASLA